MNTINVRADIGPTSRPLDPGDLYFLEGEGDATRAAHLERARARRMLGLLILLGACAALALLLGGCTTGERAALIMRQQGRLLDVAEPVSGSTAAQSARWRRDRDAARSDVAAFGSG